MFRRTGHSNQSILTDCKTSPSSLGKEIQYTVETDVGSLFIIAPVQAEPFKQGDAVTVGIVENHARIVEA